MPPALLITRTDPDDIKIRDLFVHVDDLPPQPLKYGQTLTIPLPAGPHTLKVTNGLAQQIAEFTLAEAQTLPYRAANLFLDRIISPFLFILGGSILAKIRLQLSETPEPSPATNS